MTDLGEVHHILVLHISQDDTSILIDQSHYIANILKKANMHDCIPINTPMETNLRLIPLSPGEEEYDIEEYRSIIGVLNYTAVLTRLAIVTVVGFLV